MTNAVANPSRGRLPKAARELAMQHKIQLGRAELTESGRKKDWYYYIIKAGRVSDTTRSRRPTAANALALVKRNIPKKNPCTTRKRNPCTPEAKARAVMAKMAPANYPQRRPNPDLSTEAAELMIYAENSEPLYSQRQSITKNLIQKLNRGVYDPKLAPKLWKYWFDNAAKGYTREHDVPRPGRGGAFGIFTPAIRREAAESMAKQELKLILAGEYEWILPSKKMPPWPHKKSRKPRLRLVPKKKNPRWLKGGDPYRRADLWIVLAFDFKTKRAKYLGRKTWGNYLAAVRYGSKKDALLDARQWKAVKDEIIAVTKAKHSIEKIAQMIKRKLPEYIAASG